MTFTPIPRFFKFTRKKKKSLRNLKNHLRKKKIGKNATWAYMIIYIKFFIRIIPCFFFYLLKCHQLITSINFNHHCDDGFFGLIIYFSIHFHKKKKFNKRHKNLSKSHVNSETFQNHPKSKNKLNEKNLNKT
jgi:hypothetical protein